MKQTNFAPFPEYRLQYYRLSKRKGQSQSMRRRKKIFHQRLEMTLILKYIRFLQKRFKNMPQVGCPAMEDDYFFTQGIKPVPIVDSIRLYPQGTKEHDKPCYDNPNFEWVNGVTNAIDNNMYQGVSFFDAGPLIASTET